MEKKNFWIAVGGGFVAGMGAALIASTLCCTTVEKNTALSEAMPQKIEMMKKAHHVRPHFGKPFMKDRHFKGRHGMPTPEMREHFAKKLGLTDAQKEQLDKFRDEDMAKMKPLFEQMGALHEQMQELRKVNREHFESVLTDEQKEILKEMRAKWKHHRHHPRMEGKAPVMEQPAPKAEAEPAALNAPVAVEEVVVTETIVEETPAENAAASETVPTVENAPVAEETPAAE